MAVMLSDLLRNLTFNRSAHCTQVSDQCPLGLLLNLLSKNDRDTGSFLSPKTEQKLHKNMMFKFYLLNN